MSTPHVLEHLLAYVNGNLDADTARAVADHLLTCAECSRELQATQRLWEELGRLPEESPAPTLAFGFHNMLAAFEQGMRQTGGNIPRRSIFSRFFAGRPALQWGFAACLLILGLFIGYSVNAGRAGELAQLHDEVQGLRSLLTISMLQQESASERLKAISWGTQHDGRDPAVIAALISTMQHDRNVNVRLAALDALSRDVASPSVRSEVIRSLPQQSSPLMQCALVDVLVQMNSQEAKDALRQMQKRPGLDPSVNTRIAQGIRLIL